MKINLILFLISIASLIGCDEKIQKPNCAYVICKSSPLSLKLKYVDKDTNQDLLFGNDSQYPISDLKIITTRVVNDQPTVEIDNTDNKAVLIKYIGTGDSIRLGNLPADRISISTKALSEDCCAPNIVTKLQVNNLTICEPYSDLDDRVIILQK